MSERTIAHTTKYPVLLAGAERKLVHREDVIVRPSLCVQNHLGGGKRHMSSTRLLPDYPNSCGVGILSAITACPRAA